MEILTIKEDKGTLRCPRDLNGRPNRSTYTIYKEYLEQLPPLIIPFVLSTDEVDGDGNCGFHVATNKWVILERRISKMSPNANI